MEKVVQAKREEANSPAFEDILSRLGTVVERLESGEMPLEESLSLFEEGVRLSRVGAARLDEAERRVERLLHQDGTTETVAESGEREKENEVP
jgi:exodeoxyribonuclease VII small subunit